MSVNFPTNFSFVDEPDLKDEDVETAVRDIARAFGMSHEHARRQVETALTAFRVTFDAGMAEAVTFQKFFNAAGRSIFIDELKIYDTWKRVLAGRSAVDALQIAAHLDASEFPGR